MRVEPTGVILTDMCEVQADGCTAKTPSAITAVWTTPDRRQVNVCRNCLEAMVRAGQWQIAGARLRPRADVAVVNESSRPVLVVEVKATQYARGDLTEWARQIRRNLLAHSGLPIARYFMLAWVPRRFFLWVERDPADLDARPDFEFEEPAALARYLEAQPPEVTEVWQRAEGAVASWLEDLVRNGAVEHGPWLHQSGLDAALHGGRVIREYVL